MRLLFTDIELPGLNGQELAQKLVRQRPGIGVLYTTGYAANALIHRHILEQGARSLAKPFTLTELATSVREVLDTKVLENTLRSSHTR